ncbi:hypothetical protein [Rufibacter roseus]|uniref:STAS/SEC14 domain-containing protein n=1 Tax=Rufibacter roseus TaxID=1567108 RepID=A0ABW2DSA8_9BACT|nr:hypothetical protein [Rufibacter roseus]
MSDNFTQVLYSSSIVEMVYYPDQKIIGAKYGILNGFPEDEIMAAIAAFEKAFSTLEIHFLLLDSSKAIIRWKDEELAYVTKLIAEACQDVGVGKVALVNSPSLLTEDSVRLAITQLLDKQSFPFSFKDFNSTTRAISWLTAR